MNEKKEVLTNRRNLLIGVGGTLLLSACGRNVSMLSRQITTRRWEFLERLPAPRKVVGFIIDVMEGVLVTNSLIECLQDDCLKPTQHALSDLLDVAYKHDFDGYKSSIVTLGLADYQRSNQKNEILLKSHEHKQKFNNLIHYLRENKISVKTVNSEVSHKVGIDMTPDNLLNVEYFVAQNNVSMIEHYAEIEKILGTTVFEQLVA